MPSIAVLSSILLLMAAPGPTNALVASHVARGGGWRVLIPVATGYGVSLTAYGSFLPMATDAPRLLVTLKLACAAWLCVLAVRCWRASEAHRGGGLFLTTLLNPKAAFLALTLAPSSGVIVLDLVGIGSAMLAGVLWLAVGALAGRMGAGPYASKAGALVSAAAAGLIAASTAG